MDSVLARGNPYCIQKPKKKKISKAFKLSRNKVATEFGVSPSTTSKKLVEMIHDIDHGFKGSDKHIITEYAKTLDVKPQKIAKPVCREKVMCRCCGGKMSQRHGDSGMFYKCTKRKCGHTVGEAHVI